MAEVRIRFQGGVMDGHVNEFAHEDVLQRSPMHIGATDEHGALCYHEYVLGDADEHGIHVFTLEGQRDPSEVHPK